MSVACIIIAGSGGRTPLLDAISIPAALRAGFDEVVVVGTYHEGDGYRYLHVPDITKTTLDALIKRDVGTLATSAEWLFYLADDHTWAADSQTLTRLPFASNDIIVPGRWCDGYSQPYTLNMGLHLNDPNRPYCAGHGGFFRRSLIAARPWTTMPHHPNWDLLATRIQLAMGARLYYHDEPTIKDIEPQAQPWR